MDILTSLQASQYRSQLENPDLDPKVREWLIGQLDEIEFDELTLEYVEETVRNEEIAANQRKQGEAQGKAVTRKVSDQFEELPDPLVKF